MLGVGTTLLYFMTGWDDSEAGPEDPSPKVGAVVAPNALGVDLRGTF